MGVYYIIVCEAKKEFIDGQNLSDMGHPYGIKEGPVTLGHIINLAACYCFSGGGWNNPQNGPESIRIVGDYSDDYEQAIENYTNVTQECVARFKDRWPDMASKWDIQYVSDKRSIAEVRAQMVAQCADAVAAARAEWEASEPTCSCCWVGRHETIGDAVPFLQPCAGHSVYGDWRVKQARAEWEADHEKNGGSTYFNEMVHLQRKCVALGTDVETYKRLASLENGAARDHAIKREHQTRLILANCAHCFIHGRPICSFCRDAIAKL